MSANDFNSMQVLLQDNLSTIIISVVGGLILFGHNMVEHFNRAPQDKLPLRKYAVFFIGLLLILPFLGGVVVAMYIINGDRLGPILAFQVGLTSPAILRKLMSSAANGLASTSPETTTAGQ